MAFQTVTVTWTEEDAAEVALGGYVTFQLDCPLVDTATGVIAEPEPPRSYWFTGGSGSSDPLVANDSSGVEPQDTAYTITIALNGEQPRSFRAPILAANGDSQTLGLLEASALADS
jgi:hypothetical protein